MKFIVLAMLLLCAGSKHRICAPPARPFIAERGVFTISGCNVDPLSTCTGEWLVIENPLLKAADVKIVCGGDFDEQIVNVPARTRLTVNIELTIPVEHPACQIKR